MQTRAEEVGALVDWLAAHGIVYQINGGWAVDALVGRQTRPHRDVDVFIDAERVEELIRWLLARGYDIQTDDQPSRVELAGERGIVDVHPMALDEHGNGTQAGYGDAVYLHRAHQRTLGRIAGRAVIVASAERLRELRQGYEPRPVDLHDLALLDGLSGAGG